MAKIQRKKPPKHVLVPDTNVLWHRDKSELIVSADFTKFWESNAAKYEIELILPAIVRGELLFQHTSAALTALDRANTQFETMSSIGAKPYRHRVTQARIKKDVESKIDGWTKRLGGRVAEVPVKKVDWDGVIDAAIWRRAPFLEDKDREKGFRDALILEIVCDLARRHSRTPIAFVTSDRLLRTAALGRLEVSSHVSCYDSLDEFSSDLRLLDEKLTTQFVSAIRKRARQKFYTPSNESCLFYSADVVSRIRSEFPSEFTIPPSGAMGALSLSSLAIGAGTTISQEWAPINEERRWIWHPTFVRIEGENHFIWSSRVTVVQVFRHHGRAIGGLLTQNISPNQENVRILDFEVEWSAVVGTDGRFRNVEAGEIKLSNSTFEELTEEHVEDYQLQIPSSDT